MADNVPICEHGGKGLFFPLDDPLDDHDWDNYLRAVLYACGLIYSFFGVAIVADLFMGSIEAVTSRRKKVRLENGLVRTTYLWNDTVANLSLMALGSSAPEIFLSVIDIVRKEFHASDLGSATIVGSGAFNLLVIVSVCIACIPNGEVRLVEQYTVYVVTAFFSVFAYTWLAFILVVYSPNRVDVEEAVLTLLFLPVLIYVSYRADRGTLFCCFAAGDDNDAVTECDKESDARPGGSSGSCGSGSASEDVEPRSSEGGEVEKTRQSVSKSQKMRHFGSSKKIVGFQSQIDDSNGGICSHAFAAGSAPVGMGSAESIPSQEEQRQSEDDGWKSRMSRFTTATTLTFANLGDEAVNPKKNSQPMATRRKSFAAFHNQAFGAHRKARASSVQAEDVSGTQQDDIPAPRRSSVNGEVPCTSTVGDTTVQLLIDRQTMSDSLDEKLIKVVRVGDADLEIKVKYTVDLCMEPASLQNLVFTAVQKPSQQTPPVPIGDPHEWRELIETDEIFAGEITLKSGKMEGLIKVQRPEVSRGECPDFIVSLSDVEVTQGKGGAELGTLQSTYVSIIPDNSAGMLSFLSANVTLPGNVESQNVDITVVRQQGCVGTISCKYATEKLSGVPEYDFNEAEGMLTFDEGITERRFRLTLPPKRLGRAAHDFLVILSQPEEGERVAAEFNPDEDGGDETAILTLNIDSVDPSQGNFLKTVDKFLVINSWSKGVSDWKDQFIEAVLCNGSWDAQAEASAYDWAFHFVSLPWRLDFALIPPTTFCGGWLCFYTCLLYIAALTAIVADLAELFGCVLEVPDIITAITFVALGTSMPDLFASKMAATEDPTADASIVNVTGSNSVNVFLGLGLPWSIAAIYWRLQDWSPDWASRYGHLIPSEFARRESSPPLVFVVPANNLGFSVVVFVSTAVGALLILHLRRRHCQCELGGPTSVKIASSAVFVLYWCGYIGLVSWRALRYPASTEEEIFVMGGVVLFEVLVTCWPIYMIFLESQKKQPEPTERISGIGTDVETPLPPTELAVKEIILSEQEKSAADSETDARTAETLAIPPVADIPAEHAAALPQKTPVFQHPLFTNQPNRAI